MTEGELRQAVSGAPIYTREIESRGEALNSRKPFFSSSELHVISILTNSIPIKL